MANTGKLKRRRAELYQQQGGKCFWCQGQMRQLKTDGGPFPDDLCTLDHLRNRYHPGRLEPTTGETRYVAACYACNHRRGRESHASQSASA